LHYDIRFLGVIDENSEIIRQEDEVDDIKWFLLEDIEKIISEVGTLRMMAKLKQLP
jgi:NADH pyrophosphatase NudC (nudix superfamily)